MIKTLGLALALALLGAGAAPAMDSYTRGPLEVHEAADAASRVVATLAEGEKVILRRCEADWCLIGNPEPVGWVREADLVLRGGGV